MGLRASPSTTERQAARCHFLFTAYSQVKNPLVADFLHSFPLKKTSLQSANEIEHSNKQMFAPLFWGQLFFLIRHNIPSVCRQVKWVCTRYLETGSLYNESRKGSIHVGDSLYLDGSWQRSCGTRMGNWGSVRKRRKRNGYSKNSCIQVVSHISVASDKHWSYIYWPIVNENWIYSYIALLFHRAYRISTNHPGKYFQLPPPLEC